MQNARRLSLPVLIKDQINVGNGVTLFGFDLHGKEAAKIQEQRDGLFQNLRELFVLLDDRELQFEFQGKKISRLHSPVFTHFCINAYCDNFVI